MRYGFVKAVAAAPVISVADCYGNAQNIIEIVSANKEAELVLLPELCLTSCSCGDLFTQPHFIQACNNAIAQIVESTAGYDTIVVFGAPVESRNSLYNCAIVVHKGDIIGVVPKHYPDSRNGENRWFTSAVRIPDGSCGCFFFGKRDIGICVNKVALVVIIHNKAYCCAKGNKPSLSFADFFAGHC